MAVDKEVEDSRDIIFSPLTSKSSISQIHPKYNYMASILREENFKLEPCGKDKNLHLK